MSAPGIAALSSAHTPAPSRGSLCAAGWVALAGLVILLVRKTDSFLNPQFWAEDGPVYFMTARLEGARSILRPYAGNAYVIHRAIAYFGSWLPVRYAPHFYMLACLAITLGVMAYIATARIETRYRAAMALAVVCVPHTGEVFLFLDNIHWVLALLMLVMAIETDPPTLTGKVLGAAALALMFLEGPFVLLFGPLFIIRALRWRTRYSFVLVGLAAFGALWQLGLLRFLIPVPGTLSFSYRPSRYVGEINPADPAWLGFWGNCISGILLLGPAATENYPNSVLMVVLTVALYGWLAAYGFRRSKWFCFGCFWGIFSVLGSLAYVYRLQPFFATVSPGFRYSYVPFVCTVWMLLLILERRGRAALAAGAMLGAIGLSSLTSFHFPALPDLHWAEASRGIGGPERCIVPINGVPAYTWRIYYDPELTAQEEHVLNADTPDSERLKVRSGHAMIHN